MALRLIVYNLLLLEASMAHQQPIPGDRRAQNTATPRARRALPNDDLTSDANQRRRLDEAIMPENERLAANMTRREAYAEANAARQAAQAEARAAIAAFCHGFFPACKRCHHLFHACTLCYAILAHSSWLAIAAII